MSGGYSFDIKQDYFEWLCEIVHADQVDRSWWILMKDLHKRTFYSLIPHDENRASDGLELREDYMRDNWYPKYVDLDGECTMLEMLIGLARRISFEMSNPYDDEAPDRTVYWFWEMLDNLGLMMFSDDCYAERGGVHFVDQIIDRFLEREYDWDGEGGLFPLRNSQEDQRRVEIWYQMNAYLTEKEIA